MTIQDKIISMATATSNDWYKRQCSDTTTAMYFYYKPATEDNNFGFWVGEEPLNEDWILGCNEPVSIGKTPDQVKQQIIDLAQRLPIL